MHELVGRRLAEGPRGDGAVLIDSHNAAVAEEGNGADFVGLVRQRVFLRARIGAGPDPELADLVARGDQRLAAVDGERGERGPGFGLEPSRDLLVFVSGP